MDTFGFEDSEPQPSPTSSNGGTYPREIVDEVWLSAEPIDGNDDALWRLDAMGNRIQRQDYGKRGSEFGWEITEERSGSLSPVHCRHLSSGEEEPADDEIGLLNDTPELF